MQSSIRSLRSTGIPLRSHSKAFRWLIAASLFALPFLGTFVSAQGVAITGTVYAPNGVDPLNNVLVYAISTSAVTPGTGILAPLASGATCSASDPTAAGCETTIYAVPSGVSVYTYTAVDGTFTLSNVPEDTYTVVIQAGKWRRQFYNVTVGSGGLTGQSYSMPNMHGALSGPDGYGEIPKIAIVTGGVDAVECVLRDAGVADSEFTEPSNSGSINFYTGSSGPGAKISSTTAAEGTLVSSAATLDGYDIVMFPCQGTGSDSSVNKTNSTNLQSYANTGGRIFATHYSYLWLDNANTFQPSATSGVANWDLNQADPANGPATVNANFDNGKALGQWLQDLGSSTTLDEVQISTLRQDLTGVIAPTQSWLTLNSTGGIMQMTFNTPLGADIEGQFGRVLYIEYHVEDESNSETTGKIFPAECGTASPYPAKTPSQMTAQEKMLEYSLFDLSNFVTGVVVPTVSMGITTDPSSFNEGDTADTIAVDVTNTSSTVALPSNTILTVTLPAGITATAMTDSTGGWSCTVATLTCTRTAGLAASTSDSVTLTVSVSPTATAGATSTTGTISALLASPNFSTNVTDPLTVTINQHAVVTWATPAPITYPTPLSSTQLNAVGNTPSSVPGNYVYTDSGTVVSIGSVLSAGSHTLTVTFTPGSTYAGSYPGTGTATVILVVNPPPDATSTTTTAAFGAPVIAGSPVLGESVTVTATVADTTNPGTSPAGTVTFVDTVGSTQTTLGTVAVSGGSASITYTPTVGSNTVTSSFTPANPVQFTASADSTGTSFNVAAYSSAASSFAVGAATNPVYTGSPDTVTVTAVDAYGNVITNYAGPVTLSSTDSGAVYSAPTFTNGVGTATVTFATPGSQTVTVTAGSVTLTSSPITVAAPPSFVVTSFTDDSVGVAANCPAGGPSNGNGGDCTLRDALAAVAAVGAGTITLPTNLPTNLTVDSALTIPQDASIIGPTTGSGASQTNLLTISGGGASSNFPVFTVGSGVTNAAISNITITKGNSSTSGGAIENNGTLTLTDDTLSGNTAAASGGAINNTGTLTVIGSTLSGNTAGGDGGAVDNTGTLTLQNSTVSGNFGSLEGGGIYSSGTMTLSGDTISANTAGQGGGGVYNAASTQASTNLSNTIVSGNTQGTTLGGGAADDLDGTSNTNNGGNVVGISNGSAVNATAIQLAPLGSYGGPTETMIPLPGSPAIDAGLASSIASGVTTDQRGLPNTNTSYPGCSSSPCVDAGAVETNYSLNFISEPSTTVNQDSNFSSAVTLDESGNLFTAAAVPISLTLNGNGTLSNGSATTSSGVANFSSLQVSATGTGDTLTANLTLNPASSPVAAISTTSTSFGVGQESTSISASNATPTFSAGNQSVTLSANVTSSGGTVNAGNVTFTVLQGGTVIGTPVTSGTLSNGAARATYALPAGMAAGPYTIEATYNGGGPFASSSDSSQTLTVERAAAGVTLAPSSLSQSYTGSPISVTSTTNPAGLNVTYTYNGSSTAPTAAGSYPVVATVNDPNYSGTATGTLVIAKAAATVALTPSSLNQSYTGSPISVASTTSPTGLNVTYTYNGSSTVPTASGSYPVVATISDPNYSGTATGTLVIAKAAATVALTPSSLSQTYTGSPLAVTSTTNPGGLNVTYTYNGSSTAPTAAGSYPVVATISDPNYSGTATGTLVIAKAAAAVALTPSSLSQTYTGSPIPVASTTSPAGLNVIYTYNGSSTAPTAAGSYPVVATISDPNYSDTATGTLVIAKAAATVALTPSSLSQTYTGSPLAVTSTTNPGGLNVTYTYNGSSTAPTAAGSYAVVATINDPNYSGSTTGTLVIAKAAATVTLTPSSLNQTYTGSPLSVTSTTTPSGLNVTNTYNGSSAAPTEAGSYPVVATINDPNYAGSATGTLVIAKAVAPVILTPASLSQTYTGSPLSVTSTTNPTGLAVTYTYNGSANAPTAAGSYPVAAAINDPNYTGSTTGTLVIAKAAATVTLTPSSLSQTYTGSPLAVTSTTNPGGLNVTYTYNGSSTAPTPAGSYPVVATINDPNYSGSTAGTLVISKAAATVTLKPSSLSQTYTGSPLAVTSTTNPGGLSVTYTYNGSSSAPTTAGSYPVVATINDPNYAGSTTGTLVIAKAVAPVILTPASLSQTYNGSPLAVTSTTIPTGIAVTYSYNGSSTAPTAAGSYPVTATINDPNYTGSTTGTLIIAKAAATVTLTPSSLNQTYTGSPLSVTSTTNPAGLNVTYTYNGSANAPTPAGSYSVVASINDPNYTGSTTGTLIISKPALGVPVVFVTSNVNPTMALSAVTFTGTISSTSGQPTGTVSFLDGTTALGQGALSGGVATLTTSSLTAGGHTITAVYGGDSNFSAATSAPMTQTVLNYALNPVAPSSGGSGSSQTVNAGAAANYTLNIAPTTGNELPMPTILTVSGLPAGATVSITTAPWTQLTDGSWSFPAATVFTNFGLTIQPPAVTVSQANTEPAGGKLPPLLWGVLLLPFAGRMRRAGKRLRRNLSLLLLLVVGIAASVGIIGCGSGKGTGTGFFTQQPQTYTIVVTATSGALSHSTTLTLTVQ